MSRLMLVTGLVISLCGSSCLAGPKEDKKKKDDKKLPGIFRIEEQVTLSAEQKEQFDALVKEFSPRLQELEDAKDAVLTDEQRGAKKAAKDQATAEGLKGEEAKAAIAAAINLTPDQTDKLAALQADEKAVATEVIARLATILTPEQQEQLGGKYKPKKDKKDKKDKSNDDGE